MNNELFCVNCDEYRTYTKKIAKVIHTIKGEEILIQVELPYCNECGSQLSDLEIEECNFDLALDEYRKRKKLLYPKEIKSIRELYGLSQRAFSRALGFAEPTINRYEQGAIQDSTHNTMLKLVRDPDNMIFVAEDNKENLSEKEMQSIYECANRCKDNRIKKTEYVTHEVLKEELSHHTKIIISQLSNMYVFDQKNSRKIDTLIERKREKSTTETMSSWKDVDSDAPSHFFMRRELKEEFTYNKTSGMKN